MTLDEFKKRYEEEARKITAEMPELDREEMLRPFWESRFLPANSEQLLTLAESVPAKSGKKIIGVLARAALDKFFSEYLAVVGTYAEKELEVLQKQAVLKDPVLAQFLSKELDTAAELLDSIHVNSLDDLAVFVSCLDYVSVFMNATDTPAKLKKELVEDGLVKRNGEKGEV